MLHYDRIKETPQEFFANKTFFSAFGKYEADQVASHIADFSIITNKWISVPITEVLNSLYNSVGVSNKSVSGMINRSFQEGLDLLITAGYVEYAEKDAVCLTEKALLQLPEK